MSTTAFNYKMNDIINKLLLAGDEFIPEMHLTQPGFTYNACGPFTKNKERIQKFKGTGDLRYIYKNELDKACFQHDMAYEDFKYLAKRTAADKVLRDKVFNIAKNPKYDGHQRELASMVYKYFYTKTAGSGIKSMPQNEQLAKGLHKPIIKKFKRRKVYSAFKNYTWAADLADMQLVSKFNKGFRFLLYVINISSKYAWVGPLKDKKGVSTVNAFQKILDDSTELHSKRKLNKIWVDKGSKFYNRSMKLWLEKNDIEMYSTNNEGTSVVAERFIRTLKNKIYKYMTSTSKNVYIDKLDDIVDEYNNKYHRAIKMKPIDVKNSTYINIDKELNDNDSKFKVGDHVRISKYKSIFAQGYTPNWSEAVFVIKEIKNTVPWTYVINDLNSEKIIGTFYEKELQKNRSTRI